MGRVVLVVMLGMLGGCRSMFGLDEATVVDARADTGTPHAAGLIGLWTFDEGLGLLINDTAGAGMPVHTQIVSGTITWGAGRLSVTTTMNAYSNLGPHINSDVNISGGVSLEAWVHPATGSQGDPARHAVIAGLGGGPLLHNILIGQSADRWSARVRTAMTDTNGLPGLGSVSPVSLAAPTHLVVTARSAGFSELWIDGVLEAQQMIVASSFGWDPGFRFVLGTEPNGEQPWVGTYHLVAIYDRTLASSEITDHYLRGPGFSP